MPDPIPRTRASVVCIHDNRLLVVRARDPVTAQEYLFVPGGAVEPLERPADAAAREALEEAGYQVTIDESSETLLPYSFLWGGNHYACQTYFYKARLADPAGPPAAGLADSELLAVEWLPLIEIHNAFAYHPAIREVVKSMAANA